MRNIKIYAQRVIFTSIEIAYVLCFSMVSFTVGLLQIVRPHVEIETHNSIIPVIIGVCMAVAFKTIAEALIASSKICVIAKEHVPTLFIVMLSTAVFSALAIIGMFNPWMKLPLVATLFASIPAFTIMSQIGNDFSFVPAVSRYRKVKRTLRNILNGKTAVIVENETEMESTISTLAWFDSPLI